MDLGLDGRVALVTGSTGGLGAVIAAALAAEGAGVIVCGRDADRLEQVRRSVDAVAAIPCELSTEAGVAALVATARQRVDRIDILVNCAGAARRVDPLTGDDAAFVDAMHLKYLSYVRACRHLAPVMAERGWGRIVNVIGVGGVQPLDVHLPGGAANAALILFTKGFGRVMAPANVLVNAVNPGPVASERAFGHYRAVAERLGVAVDVARSEVLSSVPIGREARAEEVADLVTFMVSERCSYLSGESINLDGGMVAGT